MKIITLAKKLDFTTETEYFDYCINSWFNGQFSQCKNLFNSMKSDGKKELLNYISGCYDYQHEVYNFYFNLL